MTFELVTLDGLKFSEEVYEIVVPTPDGLIGIFPHHMPLISMTTDGVISVRRHENDKDDAMEHFATNGGVVEITTHRVRVLVDDAEHGDAIVEQEALEALERAQEMARGAKDQVSLDKAHQLVRALVL